MTDTQRSEQNTQDSDADNTLPVTRRDPGTGITKKLFTLSANSYH